MRRSLAVAAFWLATLAQAFGAGEIVGPDVVPVYTLATVSTEVEADSFLWFVFPIETTFEANQADPRVLQFTGSPGVHHVFLVPLRDGKAAGKFRKTVTIGADPNPPAPIPPGPTPPGPNPPTPPRPDSVFGLAPLVRSFAATVPAAEKQRGALMLADAYRETVRHARDGKFAGPQPMIDDLKARMGISRLPSWSGFSLAARLNELARAGKIATVVDLTSAFQEIADALQEVADGR